MPPKKDTKVEIEETLKATQVELAKAKAKVKELETKKAPKSVPDKAQIKKLETMTNANKELVHEVSELQTVLAGKTEELTAKMTASANSERALIQRNLQLVNELNLARAKPVALANVPSKLLIRDVSGNIYEAFSLQDASRIFQEQFLTMPNRRIKDIEFWVQENGNWVRRT